MPATVRDGTGADLYGVLAIHGEVGRISTVICMEQEVMLDECRVWLAPRGDKGCLALMARDPAGGAVFGFARFGGFRPSSGHRHSVHVHADVRGHGLRTALAEPLLDRAAGLGRHVMVAGIDAADRVSIHMHARLGIGCVGTLREAGTRFGRWLALLLMHRQLDTPCPAGAGRLG